jgi:hypothetical protein
LTYGTQGLTYDSDGNSHWEMFLEHNSFQKAVDHAKTQRAIDFATIRIVDADGEVMRIFLFHSGIAEV